MITPAASCPMGPCTGRTVTVVARQPRVQVLAQPPPGCEDSASEAASPPGLCFLHREARALSVTLQLCCAHAGRRSPVLALPLLLGEKSWHLQADRRNQGGGGGSPGKGHTLFYIIFTMVL